MAIENVTGNGQFFTLQENGETDVVVNNKSSATLPSYLTVDDLNLKASAKGVLGIRLPLASASASTELMLALLENEAILRSNKALNTSSLSSRASELRPTEEEADAASAIQAGIDAIYALLASAKSFLGLEDDTTNNIENPTYKKFQVFQIENNYFMGEMTRLDGEIAALDTRIASLDPESADYNSELSRLTAEKDEKINEKDDISQQVLQAKAQMKQDLEQGSPVFQDLLAQWNTYTSNIEGLEAQIAALNAQIQPLDNQVAMLEGNIATLDGQIATLQQQIVTLQQQIDNGDQDPELQTQLDTAVAELNTATAQRATFEADKANVVATRQSLVVDRDQLVEQKAAVDSERQAVGEELDAVNSTIDTMINAPELIYQSTLLLDAASGEITKKQNQIAAFVMRQKAETNAASEENMRNAERLFETIKDMMKGAPAFFWNESNRERIMRTEGPREAKNSKDNENLVTNEFVGYAVSRSIEGEAASGTNVVSNRQLDEKKVDRIYETSENLINELANIVNALEEILAQPAPEKDIQHGKVLLSLS